jgi:hypothetical protein
MASTATVGDPITVKLTDSYNWLPLPKLGGAVTFSQSNLTGSATMMLENAAQTSWATQSTPC